MQIEPDMALKMDEMCRNTKKASPNTFRRGFLQNAMWSELPVDDPGVGLHFAVFGFGLAGAVAGHRSACGCISGYFGTAVFAHILDTLVFISKHFESPLSFKIGFVVAAFLKNQTNAEFLLDG